MDAQAHLISLGWAGPGHALDSKPYKQKGHRGLAYNPAHDPLKVGNTGVGLVKPLSISKRKDRFGIGKKSHEPPSGTEWWLKGFESALGNFGKPESERSGTSTPVTTPGKHTGLYGFFVKGKVMEGTITETMIQNKKRKSDALETEPDTIGKETKKSRTNGDVLRVSPVRRPPETALEFATVGAFLKERDKSEKRRTQKTAASAVDDFDQIGQFFAASDRPAKKKEKKRNGHSEDQSVDTDMDINVRTETKEERRQRRTEKAIAKASKKKSESDGSEDEAAKAARKAEKKRRKAEKEANKQGK